ncbi:TetR/AcrR family transcriptional regulator [Nocardia sp. CDC159]|uniref:TetR/AcrR family transcriptional regulator n=1 Tax=Nocardia pulmonis TaxID=2951408 RepID=A0A9X2E9V6_9NOCA|nr:MULTISPECIES: TetR/AcrR family transcriptional regulator [Nocardia]MCM6775518.1 TetR/AcrR family transcriptional regulator [Nocardia pulmonis]MCM6787748.1 TetR/AcrR family transcriptional regulator [Nocardia sp. CDC159]
MRPENETGGRRRSFIEEARRRQIIAAAVEVISEVGYGNASLARIAKRAGISKGVISYHFDGKDELMAELVVQLYVSGGEFVGPAVGQAVGARDKLLTYLDSNLRFIDANRMYVAAMTDVVINLRNPDGTLRFTSDEGEGPIIKPLIEILRVGQDSGEFGEFDPVVMAKVLRDTIDGAAGRAIREPDWDVDQYAAEVCRLFDLATRKGKDE